MVFKSYTQLVDAALANDTDTLRSNLETIRYSVIGNYHFLWNFL